MLHANVNIAPCLVMQINISGYYVDPVRLTFVIRHTRRSANISERVHDVHIWTNVCACVKWIDGTGNQATLSPRMNKAKTRQTPTTFDAAVARLLSGRSDLSILSRNCACVRAPLHFARHKLVPRVRNIVIISCVLTYSSRIISGWICFTIGKICLRTCELRVRTIYGLVLFPRNDRLSPMVLLIDATFFGIGRVCPTFTYRILWRVHVCNVWSMEGTPLLPHRRCRYILKFKLQT